MFRVLTLAGAAIVVFASIVTVFPILDTPVDSGVSGVAVASVPVYTIQNEPARVGKRQIRVEDNTRPSCILSAEPAVISRGEQASIAWGSENASAAWLSGIGAILPQGGTYVRPFRTVAYTLTVRSSEGRFSFCKTWITVR